MICQTPYNLPKKLCLFSSRGSLRKVYESQEINNELTKTLLTYFFISNEKKPKKKDY
jgi:CRISPR/Cas system endoribonuclease Cas6 (RAMP superfamily)